MQQPGWYLRRLRRMSGAEVAYRVARRVRSVSEHFVSMDVPPRDAYATDQNGEIWLYNFNIPEYDSGGYTKHEPKRARKLLLKKREIEKLIGGIQRDGVTLVPLSVYFNPRGIAKVELGLARGKKQYDKRETEKKRDWDKQKQRLLRDRG